MYYFTIQKVTSSKNSKLVKMSFNIVGRRLFFLQIIVSCKYFKCTCSILFLETFGWYHRVAWLANKCNHIAWAYMVEDDFHSTNGAFDVATSAGRIRWRMIFITPTVQLTWQPRRIVVTCGIHHLSLSNRGGA